jgi:hypothetical protein
MGLIYFNNDVQHPLTVTSIDMINVESVVWVAYNTIKCVSSPR